jgi:Concanavalin A-like lectin/glucanases superfamily
MARSVAASGSKSLTRASAVVTTVPFTFVSWVRPSAVASYQLILAVSDGGAAANYHALYLNPSAGASAYSLQNGGTSGEATSGGTMTANVWAHVAAVFSASNNRRAWLNGSGGTANTNTVNPSVLNTTQMGVLWTSTNPATADVAETAIYSVALADADLVSLAAGLSPLQVRPEALVAYWPLLGQTSPEIDLWRGNGLTLVNTPAAAPHCRVVVPHGHLVGKVGVGPPPTINERMFAVF